jgi:hypothetical protein
MAAGRAALVAERARQGFGGCGSVNVVLEEEGWGGGVGVVWHFRYLKGVVVEESK